MSNLNEQRAAIEAVRRGERVSGQFSIHTEQKPGPCTHPHWRTLFCDSETDVVECRDCGEQRLAVCNFDDEYA